MKKFKEDVIAMYNERSGDFIDDKNQQFFLMGKDDGNITFLCAASPMTVAALFLDVVMQDENIRRAVKKELAKRNEQKDQVNLKMESSGTLWEGQKKKKGNMNTNLIYSKLQALFFFFFFLSKI